MAYPTSWYVVPALAALAQHVSAKNPSVNAVQLAAWTDSDQLEFTSGTAAMALSTLQRNGWCTIPGGRRRPNNLVTEYLVTPIGLQAALMAWRSMPNGPVPDKDELSTRLWNLLRIRRRLTPEEAAETLVDADADFAAKKKRIGALMAAWAKHAPTAVTTGLKREGGQIRYVLTEDCGRWPAPSKAGQLHPVMFAHAQAIPDRYRKKASPVSEEADPA